MFYTINEAHKQYSLFDTIFDYTFILDLQEIIHKKGKKTYYMSASFATRHVVGFEDLSMDVFLEVQNKRYNCYLNIVSNRLYCLWASFIV